MRISKRLIKERWKTKFSGFTAKKKNWEMWLMCTISAKKLKGKWESIFSKKSHDEETGFWTQGLNFHWSVPIYTVPLLGRQNKQRPCCFVIRGNSKKPSSWERRESHAVPQRSLLDGLDENLGETGSGWSNEPRLNAYTWGKLGGPFPI